jgi:flavin-dependent dehydrogenase
VRRELDQILIDEAMRAGVEFHDRTTIVGASRNAAGEVVGVTILDGTRRVEQRASYVVAADGRESRLARSLALTRHAMRPRRWAIGAYFQRATVTPRFGEMHVRRGHYIGVAPVPGGLANVCLVMPHTRGGGQWRDPAAMLRSTLRQDRTLAERYADAELVEGPCVLGPMAVDGRGCGVPGMLLAGDAAGFIDPITGDGLRFALEGATLAAEVVSGVLAGRIAGSDAPAVLAARRRAAFARKWRFNRLVRLLVAAPSAVSAAAVVARVTPSTFASVIRRAGDC